MVVVSILIFKIEIYRFDYKQCADGLNNPIFSIYRFALVNYKESRPRNLGRGVSKPKKNTVASLLAQSRAVGLKPMLSTQQLLSQGADLVSITSLMVLVVCRWT